jgi:hypothetical protein
MNKFLNKYLPLGLAALLIIGSVGYWQYRTTQNAQATGIAYDNCTDLTSTTGTKLVHAATTSGTNDILFVATLGTTGGSDLVTGIVYNNVAMTEIGTFHVNANIRWMSLWYLLNPSSGSNIATVTTASSDFIGALAVSYSGVKQVAPEANATSTVSSTTDLANNATSTSDNAWHVMYGIASNGNSSAGSNTTARCNAASFLGNFTYFDTNAVIHPAGVNTLNMHMSLTSTLIEEWGVIIAPFSSTSSSLPKSQLIIFQ